MLTTTGVQLVRWYRMGVTDPEDLQWLLWFYTNHDWRLALVRAELTAGLRAMS